MSRLPSPNEVLDDLLACQNDLDALEGYLSSAHLAAAIDALCRQFDLKRDTSESVESS